MRLASLPCEGKAGNKSSFCKRTFRLFPKGCCILNTWLFYHFPTLHHSAQMLNCSIASLNFFLKSSLGSYAHLHLHFFLGTDLILYQTPKALSMLSSSLQSTTKLSSCCSCPFRHCAVCFIDFVQVNYSEIAFCPICILIVCSLPANCLIYVGIPRTR